jgi:hypothetical protein
MENIREKMLEEREEIMRAFESEVLGGLSGVVVKKQKDGSKYQG